MAMHAAYRWLQHSILAGQPVSAAPQIVSPAQETAEDRVNIYWEAYRLRFKEALACDFPLTQRHMGEQAFAKKCARAIVLDPPTHFNLDQYSLRFADHLLAQADINASIHELIRLEKTQLVVLAAPEVARVRAADIAGWDEQRLLSQPFQLVPALALLTLSQCPPDWLTHLISQSKPDVDPLESVNPSAQAGPSESPRQSSAFTRLLIYRDAGLIVKVLAEDEYAVLTQWQQSPHNLTQLLALFDQVELAIWQQWLSGWLSGGILTIPTEAT
jgi:Putative DNA-binding domain